MKQSLLDEAMRRKLRDMYGAPDRHYHAISHIEDLLALAGRHADLITDPEVTEAAIWFHDAILDTHRSDNETRSAALAREWLKGLAEPDRIDRVAGMIEATARHEVPADLGDEQRDQVLLFLDMDLSILGVDRERFDAYEAAVRREYEWVPEDAWRKGRADVLRRFLDRDAIFATPRLRAQFEARARDNLERSLSRLA
jgi:predicted metal-dependent HD superfamily phosphohydrolase